MRRRIQTEIYGHRGREGDPLYRIRNVLRAGQENLTDRQRERLAHVWAADERHLAVQVAWQRSRSVRWVYHQHTLAEGRVIAEHLIDTLPTCPIPEIARLGRTLRQ